MNIDQYESIRIKQFEDDEAFEWVSVTDETMEPLFDIKHPNGKFCETISEALKVLQQLGWQLDHQENDCYVLKK